MLDNNVLKQKNRGFPGFFKQSNNNYIIPPIPPIPGAPPIGGIGGVSSFSSAITHSVVRNIPAIEAAFSMATLTTFVGSITPALKRSSYISLLALKPKSLLPSFTFCTTIDPSTPEFSAI